MGYVSRPNLMLASIIFWYCHELGNAYLALRDFPQMALSVLSGLITAKSVWPEDGRFKFNCGPDECTFPVQYCDAFRKVCKYCNQDVCNTDEVPHQCRKACSVMAEKVSTARADKPDSRDATITLSPPKVNHPLAMSPKRGGQDEQSERGQWRVSLGEAIIIGITGTILIIIILLCLYKLKFADDKKPQTLQGVKQNGKYHRVPDADETVVMSDTSTKSNISGPTDSGVGNLNNAKETDLSNSESGVFKDDDMSRDPQLKPEAPPKDTKITRSESINLRAIHTQPQTENGKDERLYDVNLFDKNGDTTSPSNNSESSQSKHAELLANPNSSFPRPTQEVTDLKVIKGTTKSTSDSLSVIHAQPQTENGKDEQPFDTDLLSKNGYTTSASKNAHIPPPAHKEFSSDSSGHRCNIPQGTTHQPVEEGTSSQTEQCFIEQQLKFTKEKQLHPCTRSVGTNNPS